MTKDIITCVNVGLLIANVLMWLLEGDDDAPPDDSARQSPPKYADNVSSLEGVG
jgi:hypothetical protein